MTVQGGQGWAQPGGGQVRESSGAALTPQPSTADRLRCAAMHCDAAQDHLPAAGGLTILRATTGRIATKRFSATRDGRVRKSGYGNERFFTLDPVEAGDIYELSTLLRRLEHDPRAFIIRGTPLPDANRRCSRRLLHHDPRTGDAPTIGAADRCWVMIDLDGVACPVRSDPRVPNDAEELIDYLTRLLPAEFHEASCFWQWSASQSVPERLGGDPPDQLRAHLFFWVDRAVPDSELRTWASGLKKGGVPVDPTVFAPVQPHYTAAPIFEGVPDPLSRRSGFRKRLVDAVPLVLPPPASSSPVNARGPFFFVRSGSAGTAQNAGVLAHFSEPRAAPDSPIFGPFFVSATPLSLTKPNHARFGTDVRASSNQCLR